jgi:hypothetical protein
LTTSILLELVLEAAAKLDQEEDENEHDEEYT